MRATKTNKTIEISIASIRAQLLNCMRIDIPSNGISFMRTNDELTNLVDSFGNVIIGMSKARWKQFILQFSPEELNSRDSIQSIKFLSDRVVIKTTWSQ